MNRLHSGHEMASPAYVRGWSIRRKVKSMCVVVCGPGVAAADGTGRFLLGPLQSGVLQQEMQTEFNLPVQNC